MSSITSELKNTILKAGAGAGKTTRLVQLFTDFATDFRKKNGRYPKIVVTTFTRKATQELKERLLDRAMIDNNHELFLYINQKSKVQISTIHGVLSLFLASHGRRIGLTPDYKILPENEIRQHARKVLRQLLLQEQSWLDLLEEYSFNEVETVLLAYFEKSFFQKDLRAITENVFAEITLKTLSLLSKNAKEISQEILASDLSDSWKKWGEGLARLGQCQGREDIARYIEHIGQLREELGRKPSVTKKTEFDDSFVVKFNDVVEQLNMLADEKKQQAYLPEYWKKHDQTNLTIQSLALKFRDEYLKFKLEKGLLSMADLEILSLYIIEKEPISAQIFSKEWDFWMIDEYQDTSPIQVQLLNHLVQDRSHFVVGDPQQSIYLFRGARSEVFNDKIQQVSAQNGSVEYKLENYRSRPELLEFFNQYFANDQKFSAMSACGKDFQLGKADPAAEILIIDREKGTQGPSQAEAVIFRIQELMDKGVPAEKICVLARKNKLLEQIVHEARKYHLPVQLHSASGFSKRREVQDALAILKFLVNPYDDKNLILLLRSPWFYQTDQEIYQSCQQQTKSLWAVIDNEDLKKYYFMAQSKGLAHTLRTVLVEKSIIDYSHQVDPSGRREANLWKLMSLLYQEERRPGFNVLDFVNNCSIELSTDEGGDDADATPVIEPKRVNLMTVHASKGLQFDHVIIPNMQETKRDDRAAFWSLQESTGLWSLAIKDEESGTMQPSLLARQVVDEKNNRELEEHKRVLYVALTRAKESVSLIWEGKPGSDSWASIFPFQVESGEHQEKSFLYKVRREKGFEPTRKEIVHEEKTSVQLPYQQEQNNKLTQKSVTAIIDSKIDKKNEQKQSLVPQFLKQGLQKMQRGTDAHRLFENLKYTSLEKTKSFTKDSDFQRALDFIVTTTEVPLKKIIDQGFVEWGFTLKDENFILQGQIDLWANVDDEIWLIDYKTGAKENSDKALQQLQIYAWALHKMQLIKKQQQVHLVAVYPLEGQIVRSDFKTYTTLATEAEKLINESSRD